MQKSITLIELLISLVLIGVVILAIFGIYNASSGFFTSSDTKSEVLNEMAYLLDHLDKNVYMATGWVNDGAIDNPAGTFAINIQQDLDANGDPKNTPIDFGDDRIVTYIFDTSAGNNNITFQMDDPDTAVNPDLPPQTLTDKLIQDPDPLDSLTINYNAVRGVLTIDNLCFQQDPNSPYDAKTNPNICITSQRFSTSMQSLN